MARVTCDVDIDIDDFVFGCGPEDHIKILEEIPVSTIVEYMGPISSNYGEKELAVSYYRGNLDLKKLIREIGKENVEAALKGM